MKSKSEVRTEILIWRKNLTGIETSDKSREITRKLLSLDQYREAEAILAYMDFKNEVKTSDIISDSLSSGKRVFLPTVDPETMTMDFYEIDRESLLKSGYFGIKEPEKKGKRFSFEDFNGHKVFMTVPGVAFDEALYRIGYGKGFYDKYLSADNSIFKCGICFEDQVVDAIEHDETDVRMDIIITEERMINGNY